MSNMTAMEEAFPELGDLTVGMFDKCAENLEEHVGQIRMQCYILTLQLILANTKKYNTTFFQEMPWGKEGAPFKVPLRK